MMALSMISNWWWWKKCQPTWHIKEYDCIEVSKESPGRYRIELKMKAGYINNDKRYQLSFNSVPMLFVSHEGSGRERQPFILQTHDQGIKYINEDRSEELDHIFWKYTTGKPIFKDTTQCRIKGVNWARIALHNRTLKGKFKLEGSNEFTAKVRNIE